MNAGPRSTAGRADCLIVGYHSAVADALVEVLPGFGIDVVGIADTGAEALAMLRTTQPVVVLIQHSLPDMPGLELIRRTRAVRDGVPFITYTVETTPARVAEALSLGVRGIVLKEAPPDQLADAIRTVAEGGTYIDPRARPGW